jgi:hypothetical protein
MRKSYIFILLIVTTFVVSCWFDPHGRRETISQPDPPAGDAVADVDETKTYTTGGATSSLGHGLEYRFDLDADGLHRYTGWSVHETVSVSWPDSGLYVVKAQARCAVHRKKRSPWSAGTTVLVGVAAIHPEIRFATHINGAHKPYQHADVPLDTVGMFKPFEISYHGISITNIIEAYKFFPLTAGVTLPGQDVWTTDLSDTLRGFPNTGDDALPSGVFRLAAQCRDILGLESLVDMGDYEEGVAQVVVNYDPNTEIFNLLSNYTVSDGTGGTVVIQEVINFHDGIPDTVSYDSWARIDYRGWDDPRDGTLCEPIDPNRCTGFQVAYWKESVHNPGAQEFSLWQPRSGIHDTDPLSATDSNTFHIGSLEYELYVRSVDEFERPDGTPASVSVIGNFDPTMDMVAVEDHLGNQINLAVIDTLTWNFWKGEGWPYVCQCDTLDMGQAVCDAQFISCQGRTYPDHRGTFDWVKSWSFHIKAAGHDHPKDPPPSNNDPLGSGIKSWRYMVRNSQGQFINLGKSGPGFFEYKIDGQTQINVLDDVITWRTTYPSIITGPAAGYPDGDPYGCTVFENLPSWLDDGLTVFLIGKDSYAQSQFEFEQGIFINGVHSIINVFPDASLGRRTREHVFTFVVRLVRPGPPEVCQTP